MPANYPTSFTTDSGSLECQSSRYGHHDAVGGSYKLFLHFFPHRRNYSSVSGGIRSSSTLSSGQCTESFGRRVHLKRSKCDQFRNRVDVFIGRTGNELCLVTAAQRGNRPGAFFLSEEGRPLTKARFVARVQAALRSAGVQFSNYTCHSFRIGGAIATAQAGIQDSTIQMLGRWSSTAFLSYLRTPREQLAQFTGTLARVHRNPC